MQLITQKNIKLQNMMKVFQEIYRQGSVSRQVLSAKTDISLMTVGKIVDQLLRYDLAYEEKEDTSKVGRKGNVVSLAPDHRTIVLLDLERHNFKLGILQMDLKIKGELYQHTYDHQKSYEDNLRNAVTHFLHNWLNDSLDGVIGVGVCVPGPYYEKGDRVLDSRIPELSTAKLKQTLSPLFPGQILYIDEDVKCSVRFDGGLALQADNIFYAIIGEGVGSAIFYDGRVLGSAYSYAGEIGQMYTKSGKMIEEAVGIGGLRRLFTEPDGSVPSFQEVAQRYKNDPRLIAYLEQAIPELALLFANVTWLLDPEIIIVETHYTKLDPLFIDKLREAFEALLLPQRGDFMPKILPSTEDIRTACYKGAGLAIIERFLDDMD